MNHKSKFFGLDFRKCNIVIIIPNRSNTSVRRVTEGIGIIDAVACWFDMTDIPSSDDRLTWLRDAEKFGTIEVGFPVLFMTVVIAVDKGILPRICSDEIKGDGMVKDVFAEEYLVPSNKKYILIS